MQVCKFIKSTCCPAPNTAFSGMQPLPDAGTMSRTWGLRKPKAGGRLEPCFSPAQPQLPHLTRPKIHHCRHPGLSSALWGPCLRCSVTQGLLCKFILSTPDLIAAINTNYASLSVKLRRTRLRGSSSIQSWRTNRTAIFNPGNVSREPAAWHLHVPVSSAPNAVFHISKKYLLFSAQGVWGRKMFPIFERW